MPAAGRGARPGSAARRPPAVKHLRELEGKLEYVTWLPGPLMDGVPEVLRDSVSAHCAPCMLQADAGAGVRLLSCCAACRRGPYARCSLMSRSGLRAASRTAAAIGLGGHLRSCPSLLQTPERR